MTEAEQEEKLNDLMNKISFALKDATLQQGFEIICKRISELEKENDCYKALDSHYEEIEEDAKAIAKENEELEKLEESLVKLRDENKILFARIDGLNSKCELLAYENELLKKHCREFNANTMINFASYILYYSQNPDSKMDIPSCVYEAVENKFAKWVRMEYPEEEKTCNNCKHMLETLQARNEGKLRSAFCLDCSPNKYDNWEEIK